MTTNLTPPVAITYQPTGPISNYPSALRIQVYDDTTTDNPNEDRFSFPFLVYSRIGVQPAPGVAGIQCPSRSHREVIKGKQDVVNAAAGSMQVGVMGEATVLQNSSGSAFGMNAVAAVLAGAHASAEIVAAEMNTDARQNVTRKVGLQVIDVLNSKGSGTFMDAGIVVGRQTNNTSADAVGFKYGIQIDHAINGAININMIGGAGGIKFSGGPGGVIRSDTTTGAHRFIFADGQTVMQSSKTGMNIFAVTETDVLFPIGGSLKRFVARADGLVGWVNV
ncbi:hypothetical protein [Azospirillum soli]|uniref:hypothetical protein n=1 Tax=Azospirillum soli TaxID=1304799 RepID=UPI001AE188DF|nr:hypothetical protein [Azospirillum soli]MBP2313350.1 hypothetical protein [Azospirillum soli]